MEYVNGVSVYRMLLLHWKSSNNAVKSIDIYYA